MKQKLLKVVAVLLCLIMTMSVLAACSSTTETSQKSENTKTDKTDNADKTSEKTTDTNELEPVTLRFYFFGDKRAETDTVWNAIADKYRDKLNVDFEINFIPGSDYSQKLNVMAASGDDWDMNFDGDWLAYSNMINKDGYLDITDLLPKYAPNLYATYQEQGTLGAATVNGRVMALPWTMSMNQRPFLKWRNDYANKVGINVANDAIKDHEDIDKMLRDLRDAFPEKRILERAFSDSFFLKHELCDLAFHNFVIDLNDPECKVIPFEQTEAYKDLAVYAKKWQDYGIIWKDVLVEQTSGNQMIDEGILLAHMPSHEWVFANRNYTDDNVEIGYSQLYPDNKFANRTPLANLVAINKNAANPERVLMFLDLLETDKELYDMVHYGIKGLTYELDGETAVYPEGINGANSNYMEWGGQWALWKPQFMRPNPTYGDDFWKKEAEFAALPENVNSPLNGFFPDSSNIQNEVARRSQIWSELNQLIEVGLVDDPEAAVEEMIKKQKEAGVDKIVEELQKQVDAFLQGK